MNSSNTNSKHNGVSMEILEKTWCRFSVLELSKNWAFNFGQWILRAFPSQTFRFPLRLSIIPEDQQGFKHFCLTLFSCIIFLNPLKAIEGVTVQSLGPKSNPTLTGLEAFMNTKDLQVFPSLILYLRWGRMRVKAVYPRMADPKSSQLFIWPQQDQY